MANQSVVALGLQTATVTTYDQTKTTLQGRVASRVVTDGNGAKTVIGPSPVVTLDVFDDTGVATSTIHTSTPNGRIFISKGFAAGVLTISYYTLNTTTGAAAWVGDLKFTFTNTGAYTLKGFMVDDTTSSSMIFNFATTNTTLVQGGWYACYGVPTTDFVKVSVITYPVATTASTNKVVYQIGDQATQAAQTVTVADGLGHDTVNGFVYILNGVAATPKIYKFVYTSAPTTAPTAGYSIANGTIVVTGTLAALSGTVLLTNNVQVFTPTSQPAPNTGNNGSVCLGFITSTNIYWAKVSDITNAVTTLPSLLTALMTGTADYLIPTASFGQYSSTLDKWIIGTSLGATLLKQGISNDPNQKFISSAGQYIKFETGGTISPMDIDTVTTNCLTDASGWILLLSTSVGQRGLLALDLTSDESSVNPSTSQIFSSIISPVISNLNISQGVILSLYNELAKRSVRATVQYRTSSFSTGPGAGFDATWTTCPRDGDLSLLVNVTSVQFRILFTMTGIEVVNPPQINEAHFIYTDLTQSSNNWEGSVNNTTQNAISPSYTAFRLKQAYATSVPTLFFRAYDDSGNLVVSANTSSNPTLFQYTTNNGTSWINLGTIPNTTLTTEVRYLWATPPGVNVNPSIRES